MPGLALNCDPPDLCLQVSRITVDSHQHLTSVHILQVSYPHSQHTSIYLLKLLPQVELLLQHCLENASYPSKSPD
jgi:hypothetical protein